MGGIATLLISLVGPLVMRALLALGIGTMTFTGVVVALQGLIDIATNNWASLPSDVLALASIAGIPQALGIVAGAFTTRTGMWVAVNATRWITK
jgi:hypothetical protein